MGEEADYEMMENEMQTAAAQAASAVRADLEKEALALEEAYATGVQNYWQPGCPFKLKDVVWCKNEKIEGKVRAQPSPARPCPTLPCTRAASSARASCDAPHLCAASRVVHPSAPLRRR